MADSLGIVSLLSVFLCVAIWAMYWPSAAKVLFVAFALRVGAALFHFYVAPLPDSRADALRFDSLAWEWAQGGFFDALGHFTGPSPWFISWILSLLYAVTGHSPLLAQAVSVWMGTSTVLLGWLLARELWGSRAAAKAGWVLAFFPTLILYSALILREAYIWFFLLLALLGVVRWAQNGKLQPMLLAFFGFIAATFFHGALIVGLLVFGTLAVMCSLRRFVAGIVRQRLRMISLFITTIAAVPVIGFLTGVISAPYIGSIHEAGDVNALIQRMTVMTNLGHELDENSAAYPAWTIPNSSGELLYKAPIRAIYFLFAPFPWDIRRPSHLIGLFDGCLYLALIFLIQQNWKVLWANPATRAILCILFAYLLVFGVTVGNFGTGIRHRAKFVAVLIVLAAPLLPKLGWNKRYSTNRDIQISQSDLEIN